MRFMINASNLKQGGALQVADSLVRCLSNMDEHEYVVVLPPSLYYLREEVISDNLIYSSYVTPKSLGGIFMGINDFLDRLVSEYDIKGVFSIFAPTLWRPNVPHVAGYAYPHSIYPESPYFKNLSVLQRIKQHLSDAVRMYNVSKCCDVLITENPDVSLRLSKLLPGKMIHTVSNCPHDIYFVTDGRRKQINLPPFDGISLLYISAYYPHKNFEFLIKVAERFNKENQNCKRVRFVLTISDEVMSIPSHLTDSFVLLGRVPIEACPSLYEQCDFVFMPTLLECFSASFVESMIMKKALLVSDLGFARGLCGDGALYFDPTNVENAVDAICRVSEDSNLEKSLIHAGTIQLAKYGTPRQRAEKYVDILKKLVANYEKRSN